MNDWSLPPAAPLWDGKLVLDPSTEAWGLGSTLALDDPDFYRWGYIRQPLPPERRERWLRDRRFRDRVGNARYYSVQWEIGSEPIGLIDLSVTHPQERWAEIGYWTHPEHRGQGVATRALYLVTTWALESAGVVQIDLPIHPENEASKAVARKVGYLLRGACQVNPPVGGSNLVDLFTRRSGEPIGQAR